MSAHVLTPPHLVGSSGEQMRFTSVTGGSGTEAQSDSDTVKTLCLPSGV